MISPYVVLRAGYVVVANGYVVLDMGYVVVMFFKEKEADL